MKHFSPSLLDCLRSTLKVCPHVCTDHLLRGTRVCGVPQRTSDPSSCGPRTLHIIDDSWKLEREQYGSRFRLSRNLNRTSGSAFAPLGRRSNAEPQPNLKLEKYINFRGISKPSIMCRSTNFSFACWLFSSNAFERRTERERTFRFNVRRSAKGPPNLNRTEPASTRLNRAPLALAQPPVVRRPFPAHPALHAALAPSPAHCVHRHEHEARVYRVVQDSAAGTGTLTMMRAD
ncbi:hypothetical protein FB451DRAFT_1368507, partial [Mycena latifolia]